MLVSGLGGGAGWRYSSHWISRRLRGWMGALNRS